MLVDSVYNGKSAAEILEETKKYYVKTRELKENKIDLSTPRLFKSPSEEEMEQIVYELRQRPSIKHPIPSNVLRVTQSFCSPTTFGGTAFCITGSTELPNRMQSFSTSATSAFEPVIRTPPRPPKSEKLREKQRIPIHPDNSASTSSNPDLPPRPIPPPRRSLQKSNSRPIPPPRQRIAMTTSYHSPSNFVPFESITSVEDSFINLSNALSTPNLMNNSICCSSSFEPYFNPNKPKSTDLMTTSWYGPLTSTTLQPIKQIPNRIRIPVKPHQLTVTVARAPALSHSITPPKLIKPIPIRSPDSAFKVMRSQSSITPSRLSNFHSPGTTSGAGTGSGTSVSNPSVAEFQATHPINKHTLSSPTASKDSGAHDCSIIGSEIDDPEIKHVDKDFEARIKRWDSCSGAHQSVSPQHQTLPRLSKPPPIAPKPVLLSTDLECKNINKFFDRCGDVTTSTTDSASDSKLHDIEDTQSHEISSVDSNFTSITDNKVHIASVEKDQTRECNESDEIEQKTATKPVSIIEKNARVIQWIHGCTLSSTVC